MKDELKTPRIGVDLGGTKIEAIVLDGEGDIRVRQRLPTPKDDYAEALARIVQLVRQVEEATGIGHDLPVGIGTPGAISLKTGMMKNCNSTYINGRPLREDLAARLGRPVRIANDADCLTLSEASDGAGKGERSVFGVILGTGVGGGVCYDQQLLEGVNAICGEWGHTTLPLNAFNDDGRLQPPVAGVRQCYCSRFDCVETWLSGPAFERSYSEASGRRLPAAQVEELANEGDGIAAAVLEQYSNLLALAISTVINILDPNVFVLAGGMSNAAVLYQAVPKFLPRYVFSDQVKTRVAQAVHGDSSGVRGAAWLWPIPDS